MSNKKEIDKNHLDIIKSYASSLSHQLSVEGLHFERDDLEGEFGLIYANALDKFDPNNGSSKFETYLIAAILNRFRDIREKLIHDTRGQAAWLKKSQEEQGSYCDGIDILEILCDVASKFSSIEKKIFKEVQNPSDSVLSRLKDNSINGRRGVSRLHSSIAVELGLKPSEVEYRVRKIRKKIKLAIRSSK